MAYFYRLIFLLFFSCNAFAFPVQSNGYLYSTSLNGYSSGTKYSASEACQAAASAYQSAYTQSYIVTVTSFTEGACYYRRQTINGGSLNMSSSINKVVSSCQAGYYWTDASTCVQNLPPVCPSSGTSAGTMVAPVTGSPDTLTAYNASGCQVSIKCDSVVAYDNKRECVGTATYTGESGTGTTTTTPSTELANQFKDGYCPGEVNGTTVYVPCAEVTQPTNSTTTSNSDGSTSSTSSKTTCKDGQCTTTSTTTSTDSQGQTSSSTTTGTQSQTDFCRNNPSHGSCQSGSFDGSCTGGFQCKGDPVQCAMAKVQHENKCALTPADGEGQGYFDALTDPNPANPNNATVTISNSMFNTSNLLGVSSCSLDKSIVVAGYSVTLPFNQVCSALAYMGMLLQAVGFLLGARIITRG